MSSSSSSLAVTSTLDAAASSSAVRASASAAQSSLSAVIASASAALASESTLASGEPSNPSWYKYVGIALAVLSGFLIGSSFVFKKKGLLSSQKKYGTVAGEGVQYLKSPLWWTGMIMMIIGEVANLGGYSFAPAILVTPFGALSVVVCAVLSAMFLQETLTLFGKIGCFLCVIGSVVIALNGPSGHNGGSIVEFRKLFLSVGFLVWAGICIAAAVALIIFVAPKYGKRWMMVYISICSLLGGLSVSTTSGLGSAIVLSIRGENQLKNWFFYVLLVFVAVTLVMEILYLNKALELFNTAMVTPAYFVTFTSASIISTIVLFKGLDASASAIVTLVMGFLVICTGIVLLQLSKVDPEELAEKDVPGLDRSTTLLMRASRSMVSVRDRDDKAATTAIEDPGIDTMRGAGGIIGSIVRARSSRRIVRASADEYAKLAEEGGGGLGMSQLNTGRRTDLERFSLHDAPMPGSSSIRSSNGSRANSRAAGDGGGLEPPGVSGLLSPRSANLPKRGESMISFTSESLEPHGHHGASGQQQHANHHHHHHPPHHAHTVPTSGILAHPSSSAQHDYLGGAPAFLGGTAADRQLSNIAESVYTAGGGTPGTSMPPSPYSDPFAPNRSAPYTTTTTAAAGDRSVASTVKGAEEGAGGAPRASPDLRHMFDQENFIGQSAGGYFIAEPLSTVDQPQPGISPTTSLDSVAGSGVPSAEQQRSPSYSPPVRRGSPKRQQQQQKQYTNRSYPGASAVIGSSSSKQKKRQQQQQQQQQHGRLEEEELLSPQLGGAQDYSDDDENDDDDHRDNPYDFDEDDRRNSIRVVGGGASTNDSTTQAPYASSKSASRR